MIDASHSPGKVYAKRAGYGAARFSCAASGPL
jgi:hypothetical protein